MSLAKDTAINIFQSLPLGIILLEQNFNIQFINKYAESILVDTNNTTLIETIPEIVSTLISNDSEMLTLKDFKIKVKNSELYLYLMSIRNKNENKYLCFLTTSKINMLLSDIEIIERQFDDILNASHDGVIITDKNLITRKVNTAYQKITGADPSTLINKHANEFIKQGLIKELAVAKARKAKQRVFMVQPYPANKVALITSTPILDEDDNITMFVTNVKDLTAIYKIQEDLKNMSDAVSTNNKKIPNPINKTVYHSKIVYRSDIMERLMILLQQLSKVDSNLIIYGESGVGKGLFARTIHELSARQSGPFIKVNCSAIPDNLIESELFGYESGAFTGAQKGGKNGLIQAADKGIIFLDEIGELPYALQPKLLEFLQDGEFIRVGSTKSTKVDVRVIAATNKDLFQMVQQKTFRKDLFYRLNVVPITVPPLREHKTDIPLLIDHYSGIINNKYNLSKSFSNEAINILSNYSWPGNIRELQHLIEAAFISCFKNIISIEDTYQFIDPSNFTTGSEEIKTDNDNDNTSISYKEAMLIYEKKFFNEAITKYGSVKKAAEILKVHPATIWRKI